MSYDKKKLWPRVVVAALAASLSLVAAAQQRPDAGSIIEQQRERVRIPPEAPAVVPKADPGRPAMSASPTLHVKVSAFRISGNTVISEAELAASAG